MFSKKATKIFNIDLTLCSKCQIYGEDFVNFSGLLRRCELYLKIPDGSVMIVIPMYIRFIIVWIQDSLNTGSRCHCWGQEKIALIALNSRIIGAQGFVVITADSVHHIISNFVMGACKI